MIIFRPMLAANAADAVLQFPLLASSKLDGVRALVRDGGVYSRNNKPIPNVHVQKKFHHLSFYDGELIVGSATSKDCYRTTVSGVMSEAGEPDVKFYVFDHYEFTDRPYLTRTANLSKKSKDVIVLPQILVYTSEQLETFEQEQLALGFEGVILRHPYAPYKQGRSSIKEGFLFKLKRFRDAEFKVLGYEERMHNANEAEVNELGYAHRSSHQANLVGRGDLGALILHYENGTTVKCGTGFTDEEREEIWQHREQYLGRLAKVKYLAIGMKDKPRHPVFLGWRDTGDL